MRSVNYASLKAIVLFGVLSINTLPTLYAQEFGPELIPFGNFGTIETYGKNGDALGSKSLYPGTESSVGTYYQPLKKVWSGWWPVVYGDLDVNPHVTIGHAVDSRTTYQWGMNETWSDGRFLMPRVSDQGNSSVEVRHAPGNGYYVIATSTAGMYRAPVLSSNNWVGPLYDRFETDIQNPTHYFMVVDADVDPTKIFYKEEVNVEPGRHYRLSADVARLNRDGVAPSIAFVVSTSPNNLSTIAAQASKTLSSLAVWEDVHFDYVAPAGVTKVYVAFRNNVSGGTGNDLALDDLSMREIVARIAPDLTATNPCTVGLTLKFVNSSSFAGYSLGWQKKNTSGAWVTVASGTASSYVATAEGDYRAIVYIGGQNSYYTTNEIHVSRRVSCFNLVFLQAPDYSYEVLAGGQITKNVLVNASSDPSGGTTGSVSVVQYAVNGVTHSVGSVSSIYEGSTLLGTVNIASDGTLVFKAASNVAAPKQMPTITYTVQSSFGTEATGNVSIKVVDKLTVPIALTYDASCVQCPVYVHLTSGVVSGQTYTLYRNNQLKGTFSTATADLTFNETVSGVLEYEVRNSASEVVKTFTMEVHPAVADWKASPTNTVWKEASNWNASTGASHPIWCTDVTIPSVSTTYPMLVDGDAARDITFKDGASVGQIQKLTYRKAFVELNPARNRWYMLAAPLRYMYSADLHGDISWTNAVSPKIFMMYFDITSNVNPDGRAGYSAGNFSRPFSNLEEALTVGKSYTLWVNGKENGFVYADDNFPTGTPYKFPRLANGGEPQFSYHRTSTGAWTTPVVGLNRGKVSSIATDEQWLASKGVLTGDQKDNRYRFLFEESISGTTLSVPVQGGVLNAISNPFMSHLDFERFVLDNSAKIQGYYRIWDGSKFYLYVTDNSANTLWKGLGGLTTETSDEVTTQFIAPMQSFFVEVKTGVSSLEFKTENILGANSLTKLRSTATASNLLKIELKMGGVSSRTFVAVRDEASAGYNSDEDIKKLFSPNAAMPEIYTVADKESIELNMIGSELASQEVSLGIRTTQVGDAELLISGANDFDRYSQIQLKDNVSGQIYDLKNVSNIKFSKTSQGNLETRFSLLLSGGSSSLEPIGESGSITIIDRSGALNIESNDGLLKSVELFDASGRLAEFSSDINSSTYVLSKQTFIRGVFVVRVTSEKEVKTLKVAF